MSLNILPPFPIYIPDPICPADSLRSYKRKRESEEEPSMTKRRKIEQVPGFSTLQPQTPGVEEKGSQEAIDLIHIFDDSIQTLKVNYLQIFSKFTCLKHENAKVNPSTANKIFEKFMTACERNYNSSHKVNLSFKRFKLEKGDNLTLEEVKKLLKAHLRSCLIEYARQGHIEVIQNSFKINEELIKDLNLSKTEKKEIIIDCYRYALHEHGLPCEYWIDEVNEFLDFPFENYGCLNAFMSDWDYEVVEHPQKDDMIVYLTKEGNFEHAGIMIDAQTVRSKWGKVPQIFAHPIEACPYNNSYFFLRKNS